MTTPTNGVRVAPVMGAAAFLAYLAQREAWTFGFSREGRVQDCARFCDGGVLAFHGVAPLASFAGQWSTARGAARLIRRAGGLVAAVSTVMDPVSVSLARRADVALFIDAKGAEALALVEGPTLVGPADGVGLSRLPRGAMVRAWTVRS